jgi:hypothetical protein
LQVLSGDDDAASDRYILPAIQSMMLAEAEKPRDMPEKVPNEIKYLSMLGILTDKKLNRRPMSRVDITRLRELQILIAPLCDLAIEVSTFRYRYPQKKAGVTLQAVFDTHDLLLAVVSAHAKHENNSAG